ncbi:zinc ribbon-containing protein [Pseudoalteromonas shioyasakiensis]|uniref:zinc ribbon-containing protein n=1 Tax=Pseudoalteromonas shioyasakiensis TaxID=1190813 RepID=UPI002118F5B9|nr:zinc ribbon-containing protein [Pseudoalteromonas shioyasakiensis]MCQ8877774.1 zinc ribbon-containing protein [Pseudoalteromonas shioyasakiensis]
MADYKTWLNDLTDWLKDVKDHELKDAIDKFVESEQALKNLGQEKLELYRNYLKRDIEHIQEHDKHYNSLAWQELKESLWYELSHIEDKTQLEWQALNQDFKHNGVYHQGEWIAMGTLVCKNCNHSYDIYHAAQIRACSQCNGIYFSRRALQP